MRSFLFKLGTPGAGETAIASVRLYKSANGLTGWALVNSVAVGSLTDDVSGKKRWENAAADPTNYAKLAPVSASGIERPGGVILPPAPVDPDTFKLFCYTRDLGLGVVAGEKMSATPAEGGTHAVAGDKLAVKGDSAVSDSTGYVTLSLPADAGRMDITIARHTFTIDSAGRTGQIVNVASLL